MPKAITTNTLFYGDNLPIVREYVPDESVDLIYLDPPFNSNRNYNVLFKDERGVDSEAQIVAFADTWHWGTTAEAEYDALITTSALAVSDMLQSLRGFIGTNQMMAYLVMMTARLVELHRVLKPTGSLYLHCDPTASHYLKIILDTIFGAQNYRTEISWRRSTAHNDAKQGRKQYGNIRDIVFFYTKSDMWTWNWLYTQYDDQYITNFYKYVEPETNRRYALDNLTGPGGGAKGNPSYEVFGVTRYWRYSKEKMSQLLAEGRIIQSSPGAVPRYKRYLDEMLGVPLQNDWDDIKPIQSKSNELLGYPTQKPLALLERIIQASSNEGDVVLDPFAGCGTTIAAAQKLNRRWIGIDITHLSIALLKYRLTEMYPAIKVAVIGEPQDIGAATQLAHDDRYQFQWWALSLVKARPLGGDGSNKQGKKGSDKGIDGIINFIDDASGKAKRAIIQVKSGNVKSGDIRDLVGVLQREKAEIGVFITLAKPSRDMITEAVTAGFYESQSWGKKYPRLQILTIEDLLTGKTIAMPPAFGTFKQVQRVQQGGNQLGLDDA